MFKSFILEVVSYCLHIETIEELTFDRNLNTRETNREYVIFFNKPKIRHGMFILSQGINVASKDISD